MCFYYKVNTRALQREKIKSRLLKVDKKNDIFEFEIAILLDHIFSPKKEFKPDITTLKLLKAYSITHMPSILICSSEAYWKKYTNMKNSKTQQP